METYEFGNVMPLSDAHTLYERVRYFRLDVMADANPRAAKLPKAVVSIERFEERCRVS
jgi:hypothetical protein